MKNRLEIKLLELLLIIISIISISGIILFTFGKFSSPLVLIISIVIFVLFTLICKPKIVLRDDRFNIWVGLILIISLLIRLGPWQDLEGGQDQGIYLIMSGLIEREGDSIVNDRILERLSESDKEMYQSEKGWLSSTALRQLDEDSYQYIFYPLFPSLIALSGYLSGDSLRLYILTFFSVFSILSVYLLAFELTKDRRVGYTAAILLSIAPLHMYFSRFTVTEVLMITFNMFILYYLLKGFQEKSNFYLLLSLLIFILLLFTKITGIVMVVYLSFVFLILLTYSKKELYTKYLILYSGFVYLFLISLLFYKYKIFHLYGKFYIRDVFDIIPELFFYIIFLLLPLLMFIFTKYINRYIKVILRFLYRYRIVLLYFISLFLIIAGLYFFYKIAFTDKYNNTLFDYFWGMSGGGWIVLKDTVLISVLLHLTPIGLLFIGIFFIKVKDVYSLLIAVFFLLFLAFNIFINKFTPYQYYYARYLLSEVFPAGIIMMAVSIYYMKDYIFCHINIKWLLSSLYIIYGLLFSVLQFQGPHGADEDFFKEIETSIKDKKNDLILYYEPSKFSYSYIFAPLRDYYGYNSLRTGIKDNFDKYVDSLPTYYNSNIYVISSQKLDDDKRMEYIKTIKYEKGFYAAVKSPQPEMTYTVTNVQIPYCNRYLSERYCSGILPVRYHKAYKDMYLYIIK